MSVVYSTKRKPVSVHIGDAAYQSWVALEGVGLPVSKIEIVSGANEKDYSELVIRIPMLVVETVL